MFKFSINKEMATRYLPSLIAGVLGALTIQLAFHAQPRVAIATVNIVGMVKSFEKETAKQNLSIEEQQKKVNQFGLTMQKVIDETAISRHKVIVPSEAVLAGAIDLTDEVAMRIKKDMKP